MPYDVILWSLDIKFSSDFGVLYDKKEESEIYLYFYNKCVYIDWQTIYSETFSWKIFPSLYIRPPKHTNDWLIHKNSSFVLHRKYTNYDYKPHPEYPWFETVRIWDDYSSNPHLPVRGTRSM